MIKVADTENKISSEEIKELFNTPSDTSVKFSIDLQQKVIALGGEMHADSESLLLGNGSDYKSVWSCTLFPLNPKDAQIEYSSLLNIKPSMNNPGMEIISESVRNEIRDIVDLIITK